MVNIVFISLNCNVCNYTYLKWLHTNTEEHSTLISIVRHNWYTCSPCVELFICQDSLGMEVELTRCHGTCINHHNRLIVSLWDPIPWSNMVTTMKPKLSWRKSGEFKDVDKELNDLVVAAGSSRKCEHPWRNLLQKKYTPHLTMTIMIPFFQQLRGINVIMFYTPVLLKTIGFVVDSSLMSVVTTDHWWSQCHCAVISIYYVDKLGMRLLFLEGGVQMLFSQVTSFHLLGLFHGEIFICAITWPVLFDIS